MNENGYYHIIDEPGKQRTVSIRVYNLSEEEISVNVTVNPASTNQNGIPSYLGKKRMMLLSFIEWINWSQLKRVNS